jgi:predicted GNAT superfamily acetyltransferase
MSIDPAAHPTIRELRPGDVAAVRAINEANVPEVGSADEDRLRFLIAESAIALVVVVEGAIAGFCLVLPLGSSYDSVNYRWFSSRYDDVMYLDRVAFDERFRRRGLGTLLYDEVERRVAASGAAALALEVNADPPNTPSLAFHEGRGFVEVGRQNTPYGIVVSMMRKELAISDDPA